LAALNIQSILEQYLLYEHALDELRANELGFSMTDFPFETWASLAINALEWADGEYNVE
jgi:hypothetical protein